VADKPAKLAFSLEMREPELPRKEPTQERSRAVCDAILESAARVFDSSGYDGTTTNRVAELAGVSVGSMYQYYPNKDALLTALHERHVRAVSLAVSSCLASDPSLPLSERVAQLVAELLAIHRQQPQLQVLLHGHVPFLKKPLPASEDKQRLLHALAAWIGPQASLVDAYLLLETAEALIHSSALEPPAFASSAELEAGIVRALLRMRQV
jgi:AcrR family transcriptional regulator